MSRFVWLAALAMVSASAFGAQTRIHSVSYDLTSGTLVITGEELKGVLAATTVKIGGAAMSVLANTSTSLTAQLPAGQTAGEYEIYVKRGLLTALESVALSEASYSLSIIEPVPGPVGPEGPTGPAGISGYTVMTATSANDSIESRILTANCPAGKTVLGGGQVVSPVLASTYRAIGVPTSRPTLSFNGWTAAAVELPTSYTANWQLIVYAICANVAP